MLKAIASKALPAGVQRVLRCWLRGNRDVQKAVLHNGESIKILYAPIQSPNVFQMAMLRALVEVGTVQTINYRAWTGRNAQKTLLRAIENTKPDIIHMQIQQDLTITPKLLWKIKKEFPEVILSHWTGDNRYSIPSNLLECAKICDFTFTASYTYTSMFRQHGCNAYYLQHSYEPVEHYPRAIPKTIPVIYLGNYFDSVSIQGYEERLQFVKIIKKFDGHVYGNNWPEGISNGRVGYFCGSGSAYSSAKIVLNVNHWLNHMMYQSDRWFHAAASGSFTLSYYHPGTEYVMDDKKHTCFFQTAQELGSLIEYYLTHDDEREKIALQGHEFCLQHHNPVCRAQDLMRIWTCPIRGLKHWPSKRFGQAEADFVKGKSKGRILDLGAALQATSLAKDPLYTNVDGNSQDVMFLDSILKTPFHSGIFDTVTLQYVKHPLWQWALREAIRLANKTIIIFTPPQSLDVPGFSVTREKAYLVAQKVDTNQRLDVYQAVGARNR